MQTRREFLATAAGSCMALWGVPQLLRAMSRVRPRRPNVLFIAVDDLRTQLGCYGVPWMKTPNIDALAARGTLFEQAYCQQAVCAPSRASLLSGLRPDSTRVWDLMTTLESTRPDVTTLPQFFRAHGYDTISLGKIYHHGIKDDPRGWTVAPRGSKKSVYHSDEGMQAARAADPIIARRRIALAAATNYAQRADIMWHDPAFKYSVPFDDCTNDPDTEYPDGDLTQQALAALRQERDRPFFLAVGYWRPHLPFSAPKKYWDMYERDALPMPSTTAWPAGMPPLAASDWSELKRYTDGARANEPAFTRRLIHAYCACVSFVDAQIGLLLAELDRRGLSDNTVIILWGDHGWKLGEYGAWCKHTNFELDVRAPLLLAAPGFRGGQRSAALVEFVDIYPTLAELCGLPVPAHLEGRSMKPLLEQPQRAWKDAAFSQYPREGRVMGYSMRTRDWRYTEWIDRADGSVVARELYDLRAGTIEAVNLADDPAHADTVARLSQRLAKGQGWRHAAAGTDN